MLCVLRSCLSSDNVKEDLKKQTTSDDKQDLKRVELQFYGKFYKPFLPVPSMDHANVL
jgi:hypothetical protein